MPTKIRAPGQWWRDPLSRAQKAAAHGDSDQLSSLRALERYKRVERLKQQLREVREYVGGFAAHDGYPLSTRELIRLPAYKITKIRDTAQKLRGALARPHVIIQSRSPRQRKSAKRLAGQLFENQKKYIFHTVTGAKAQVSFDKKTGQVQVKNEYTGGSLLTRYYLFPRLSKRWEVIVSMIEDIFYDSPDGYYKLYNTVYGPIGRSIHKSLFIRNIDLQYSGYDVSMYGTISGVVWIGSSFQTAVRDDTRTERIRGAIRDKLLKRYRDERAYASERLSEDSEDETLEEPVKRKKSKKKRGKKKRARR